MLIVFEGIDGCGKDTQIEMLRKELDFEFMRYPTRNFGILNDYLEKKVKLSSKSLFHLFLADIANEQEKLKGREKPVVLSRYVFSTIAYEVDGISYEQGKRIVEDTAFLKPDLVIYLDISAEISQARKSKQKDLDRYEEDKKYLSQVRANYLKLYEDKFLTTNWRLVDASKNIDAVHAEILNALRDSGVNV